MVLMILLVSHLLIKLSEVPTFSSIGVVDYMSNNCIYASHTYVNDIIYNVIHVFISDSHILHQPKFTCWILN